MRKSLPRTDSVGADASSNAVPETSRRRFLFALSAGSAGAVAAAAAPVLAAPTNGADAKADVTGSGYQETEHVRDYYATTRL